MQQRYLEINFLYINLVALYKNWDANNIYVIYCKNPVAENAS